MSDQFDFEQEYEGEVNTLEGAPPHQPLDQEAAKRERLYRQHMQVTAPDGSPILQGESAQQRLEREARRAKAQAARQAMMAQQRIAAATVSPEEEPEAGEEPTPEEEAIHAAVEGVTEERRSVEATLSEAERRFDKARYYKMLLSQPLIADATPAGQEVEREIKEFAQERFEIFLGMRQERPLVPPQTALPPQLQAWEPEDFQTLHDLIRSIRQKAGAIRAAATGAPAPRPEPSINPVGTVTPLPPPPPAQVSLAKPPATPLSVPPVKKAAPPVKKVNAPSAASASGKKTVKAVGGHKRILVPLVNPMDGKVMTDATGRPLQKDITGQVQPSPENPVQPVPFPATKEGLEALHESKANEAAALASQALAKAEKSGIKMRIAIAHAQVNGTQDEVLRESQPHIHDPLSSVIEPGDLNPSVV